MEESEYRKRFKARLAFWGVDEKLAQMSADAAQFEPSADPEDPEAHADDELSYMADA